MPNEFFPARRKTGGKKFILGMVIMIGKISIVVFWFAWLIGAGLSADILAAAEGLDRVYLSQKAAGPQRTNPPSSEAAAPATQEKAQDEKAKEQKPAAPAKKESPRPFEPTEKVKADQAIDFPADI
jgi:hypothetical protein